MQCPRCLNTDTSYFYKGSRGWYCRRCISFGRMMLEEDTKQIGLEDIREGSEEYSLKYPLTYAQERISKECADSIRYTNVLLHCVCGAGKTELVVESISRMLKEKKKVCFAIPRRQVVLELKERLSKYFAKAKVIAVCGGHTDIVDGDLIICTTHQLYRYYKAFDLLILDEPDAFPFKGNPVLHGIAKTSTKNRIIYMTATIDEYLLDACAKGDMKVLTLKQRPHGKPLPVPRQIVAPKSVLLYQLIRWIDRYKNHPRMIFVPTIRIAKELAFFLKLFYPECLLCTSQSEDKDRIIYQFRKKKQGLIVTTTVLERGVTILDAQICVFLANHSVFDKASLIQIAGRAGRNFKHPYGDVLFLCNEIKETTLACIQEIEGDNRCAV